MAHFAKISEENEVLQVLTLNNKDMHNADGVEVESIGQEYLQTHNNWPAHLWIQTSYNTRNKKYYQDKVLAEDQSKAFRGNYANIGYTWDEDDQIFWPKKPFASWVKHNDSASWKSPIGDAPTLTTKQDLQNETHTHKWGYFWNESTTAWDLINELE